MHENGLIDAGADGSIDGDSVASELGEGPFDCVILGGPGAVVSHPHVEGRFVEVNQGLLLFDQSCQMK